MKAFHAACLLAALVAGPCAQAAQQPNRPALDDNSFVLLSLKRGCREGGDSYDYAFIQGDVPRSAINGFMAATAREDNVGRAMFIYYGKDQKEKEIDVGNGKEKKLAALLSSQRDSLHPDTLFANDGELKASRWVNRALAKGPSPYSFTRGMWLGNTYVLTSSQESKCLFNQQISEWEEAFKTPKMYLADGEFVFLRTSKRDKAGGHRFFFIQGGVKAGAIKKFIGASVLEYYSYGTKGAQRINFGTGDKAKLSDQGFEGLHWWDLFANEDELKTSKWVQRVFASKNLSDDFLDDMQLENTYVLRASSDHAVSWKGFTTKASVPPKKDTSKQSSRWKQGLCGVVIVLGVIGVCKGPQYFAAYKGSKRRARAKRARPWRRYGVGTRGAAQYHC